MEIKIAYLYYDLMNLYGENGNVKVLKHQLEKQGVKVQLFKLSVEDELDFDDYDVFVMGSGTEHNQIRVLNNLTQYSNKVKKAIADGKFFLCTGNSFELFGRALTDVEGNITPGVGQFSFDVKQTDQRMVDEVLFKFPGNDEYILGFQNQGSSINNFDFNLFEVVRGIGNSKNDKMEGIYYKNFFGTYVLGPILARNPFFLEYLVNLIIKAHDASFEMKPLDLDLDKKAYMAFMKKHYPKYYKKQK